MAGEKKESTRTAPSKCRHCDRPLSEVLVCDTCHTLNPEGLLTDYFSLLGVPRKYDIDADDLRARFFAINRYVHPDRQTEPNEQTQQLSLAMSAAVNNAYRTLNDPVTRAAYLLELLGGKSSAADKSVPDGFLNTTMMMQEELADAKAAGDTAAVGRLREALTNQRDGMVRKIGELFCRYDQAVGCEAIRRDLLDELRKELNAVSYVRKLLSQASQDGLTAKAAENAEKKQRES